MRVKPMVEVNIARDVRNINEIEGIVYGKVREAGKELMVELLKRVEKKTMKKLGGLVGIKPERIIF